MPWQSVVQGMQPKRKQEVQTASNTHFQEQSPAMSIPIRYEITRSIRTH